MSEREDTSPQSRQLAEQIHEGDRLLRARCFVEAVAAFQRAADSLDTPPGSLCAKLARALAETGQFVDASAWAVRVADSDDGFSTWSAAARVLEHCGTDSLSPVRRRLRVGIVSTWTTHPFVPLFRLAAARAGIVTEVHETPFDQYFNQILDPRSALFDAKPDCLVLCPDYRAMGLASFSEAPQEVIEAEVQRWGMVWEAARAVEPLSIVQHNFAIPARDVFGHFGSGLDGARRAVAGEINRRLAGLACDENVGLVDVDSLAGLFGKNAWFKERNWHLAKVAVAPAALPLLARHTVAVLAAQLGLSRRCLVLDLDNTLWGGVVADDGVDGIVLGQGPDGEAFVDFQRSIKELSNRGVALAVCSKNDMETAREPFVSHPEMVLKLEDIATFVANWQPKSENLIEIARTLNLGLDTLTFVDDSPYERAEVRLALPEVDQIALPSEPAEYRRALLAYPFFEPASFTAEDRKRSEQYQARAKAEHLRASAHSLADYQATLSMVATLGPIDRVNVARVVQLINKTNQFNLTTRRYARNEVEDLLAQEGVEHFWVRLRDRFADHGLIAVAIGKSDGRSLEIDTFLMSCRVIGRGVEQVMRDELVERAKHLGCRDLRGVFIPTNRNSLVADLFPRLGFTESARSDDGRIEWVLPVDKLGRTSSLIAVERTATLMGT